MKKHAFLFTLLIISVLPLYSIEKSNFDLQEDTFQPENNLLKTSAKTDFYKNDILEASLITGGYFTLGTNSGLSPLHHDDQCDLLFGHPYAKTSYPIVCIDGQWSKLTDCEVNSEDLITIQSNDSLFIQTKISDNIQLTFGLVPTADKTAITVYFTIKNIDAINHNIGMGLVFDPALGKWGDGVLKSNSSFYTEEFVLFKPEIPDKLTLFEKSQGAKGIQLCVDCEQNVPDKMIVANWQNMFEDPTPDFSPSYLKTLYDMVIKLVWQEQTFFPDESKTWTVQFRLEEPDFSGSAFIRCDMPSFLSMASQELFPNEMNCTSVIYTDNSNNTNLTLTLPEIFSGETTYAIPNSDKNIIYVSSSVSCQTVYDDIIVPVTLKIEKDGSIADEYTKNIFVPATPLSDEGLIVNIDSIAIDADYNTSVFFDVENEETGLKLLNLEKENVFLYENSYRIQDIELTKDMTSTANLADVVFVLDVSGSMGDEINQVRENINEFNQTLTDQGFDVKIGVVTFSTTIDNVIDLTDDIEYIRQKLALIQLWGGVEDSPLAIYRASELSLRPGSKRTIIWITDEPYPEHSYTKQQIVDRMLSMGITVHGIGLTSLQTLWFNPIVLPTGGNFYDINGNFRDILLDVSHHRSVTRYVVKYNSLFQNLTTRQILLKIHYAGLGGSASIDYVPPEFEMPNHSLSCYPNPFNPSITIQINQTQPKHGDVTIYNLLGQRINQFPVTKQSSEITWNASDYNGLPVSAGFYLVHLLLYDNGGNKHVETEKILYLK